MSQRSTTSTAPSGLRQLLTTNQVAKALQVSPSTLCRWRAEGVGPKVVWVTPGAPRYFGDDVNEWLERNSR